MTYSPSAYLLQMFRYANYEVSYLLILINTFACINIAMFEYLVALR